jgi:hypothetical protein
MKHINEVDISRSVPVTGGAEFLRQCKVEGRILEGYVIYPKNMPNATVFLEPTDVAVNTHTKLEDLPVLAQERLAVLQVAFPGDEEYHYLPGIGCTGQIIRHVDRAWFIHMGES